MVKESSAALQPEFVLMKLHPGKETSSLQILRISAGPLDASDVSSGIKGKQAFFASVTKNGQCLAYIGNFMERIKIQPNIAEPEEANSVPFKIVNAHRLDANQ